MQAVYWKISLLRYETAFQSRPRLNPMATSGLKLNAFITKFMKKMCKEQIPFRNTKDLIIVGIKVEISFN